MSTVFFIAGGLLWGWVIRGIVEADKALTIKRATEERELKMRAYIQKLLAKAGA